MLKRYRYSLLASLLMGLSLLLGSPLAHAQRPALGGAGATTQAAPGGGGTLPPVYVTPEETPWSHLIDSLTAHLNKSGAASGILYDRALPLAALHAFGLRQADTTANGHLRQAYLELWIAAYDRTRFRLTPDQFREKANRVVRHDSVPLAVLDYQFHYLDSLAVRDGLVTVQEGLLYDVASPSRSPYLLRNLVLAAPLLDTLRQYSATFVLPPALLLTNRTRRVSSITIDFNDGGPNRTLLPGQSFNVSYASNGRKVVWIIAQFNDGSTAQVRSSIYVKAPTINFRSIPITLANLGEIDAKIPFRDYNSTTELFGKGQVLAVLHHPASQSEFDTSQPIKLRRPVIVMDGFDPDDKSRLFVDNPLDGSKSLYNDLRDKRILELLDDTHLQRDLIILNFPKSQRNTSNGSVAPGDVDGGADYIERNAFVLVELINQLKSRLAIDPATGQPYQFTIIGPSMGGLVSRYALAYMEKQAAAGATPPSNQTAAYWQHNTATWLSFDAPHQGAVVPMGDQAFLRFFQGMAAAARESLNNTLYSPAAKQMLVHHIAAPGTSPAGAPGFRDRFMRALRDNGEPGSLGYPVHLRRVALANGRLDGQGDPGGTPCGTMFDLEVKMRTGNAILATIGSLLFSPFSQSLPTRVAACNARYAPAANTSCTVFEGVFNYGIYGYSLPPGGFYYVPRFSRQVVASGSQGSYDLSPGGLRNTQATLARLAEGAGRTAGGREEFYKVTVTNVRPNHCFIPTVSALGFQYQTMSSYQNTGSLPNPYTNLANLSLICNNEIPFDDYYAPGTANSEHVTVPGAGAQAFLIRELTPRVATPVFTAAPTAVCPDGGGTATFSVAAECARAGQPGTTYAWTLGPGLQYASGSTGTGPSQSVRATPGFRGTATLQVVATRTGYAASTPAVRYLDVADGSVTISHSPGTVSKFELFEVTLGLSNATSPHTWSVSPSTTAHITAYNGASITLRADRAGFVTITGTATNACNGSALTVSDTLTIAPGYFRSVSKEAAYPNPADDVLTLTAPETATAADPRTAVLYNAQGREVGRTTAAQADQLRTAGLPEGLYYLLVEQNGRVTRSQIRVQH